MLPALREGADAWIDLEGDRMLNVGELRASLAERGASWTAGSTRLSRVDPARRRALAGVPDVPLEVALRQASSNLAPPRPSTEMPPVRLDWRDYDGGNWVAPVRDQDLCMSCTAFATCAVMESRLRIDACDPNIEIALAPGPLFHCGHSQGCAMGRSASEIMGAARQGVGLERVTPYSINDQSWPTIVPVARVTATRQCIGDIRARKFFVLDEGPVYAEMRLYEDFYAYEAGVYRHATGIDEGLHAIAVVGYDDSSYCWIVKNSWGNDVQEAGFFRIGYGECEIDKRPFIALDVERLPDATT